MKNRDERRESRSAKVCQRKRETWAKLKQRKLYASRTRLKELEHLQQQVLNSADTPQLQKILCINVQQDVEQALQSRMAVSFYKDELLPRKKQKQNKKPTDTSDQAQPASSIELQPKSADTRPHTSREDAHPSDSRAPLVPFESDDSSQDLESESEPSVELSLLNHPPNTTMAITRQTEGSIWYPLKHFFKEHVLTSQALLYEIDVSLPWELHETVLSMSTLLRLPLVVLCRTAASPDAAAIAQRAREHTGAWKVLESVEEFVQDIIVELPKLVALCEAIAADVNVKVEDLKKVNPWLHGVKRGSVALIPFGVHTVNFVGMMRLVRRMLTRTGMLNDKEAKKAAKMEAAATGLKITLIDALATDVYQTVIFATVLATFLEDVMAGSFDAAWASLDAVDFALLGSMSVVTGTVSAVGAYINRPRMVTAIARFLTTLQLVYVLSPSMRRTLADDEGVATEAVEDLDSDLDVALSLKDGGDVAAAHGDMKSAQRDTVPIQDAKMKPNEKHT